MSRPYPPPMPQPHPGLLVVISGPSGVGKTTITRHVVDAFPDAVFSVSMTTRPKTDADREGVDYFFVTDEQFDRVRAEGGFLEWAEVFGRKYGTPADWVQQRLREGKLVILEIDVRGAAQVRATAQDMFGIFVLPPSEVALLQRLRHRKRDPEDVIQRRFAEAKREIAEAQSCGAYDEFLINDDLDRAVNRAVQVIRERRGATNR
jgi:guanylate kinase